MSPFIHIADFPTKLRGFSSIRKGLLENDKMRVYRIEGSVEDARMVDACSMGEFRAGLLQSLGAMCYYANHIDPRKSKSLEVLMGDDESRAIVHFDDVYAHLNEPFARIFVQLLYAAHNRDTSFGLSSLGDLSSMRSSTLALSHFATLFSGRLVCNLSKKGAEVFRTALGSTLDGVEREFGRHLGPSRMLLNTLGESTNLVCLAN